MMGLRVSVVLLFVFLTGGYSLRCYSCSPDLTGSCESTVETCPYGNSECVTYTGKTSGYNKVSVTSKGCLPYCEPGTHLINGVTVSISCCDTDLCNAADEESDHEEEENASKTIHDQEELDMELDYSADGSSVNTGYSLRCYSCSPDLTGSCDAKVETCPYGNSECVTYTGKTSYGYNKVSVTSKGCLPYCEPGTHLIKGVTVSISCCDTDLCNAADGMYKGSFFLLFSPLLFYFLFQ